jgi:hypothetical protein
MWCTQCNVHSVTAAPTPLSVAMQVKAKLTSIHPGIAPPLVDTAGVTRQRVLPHPCAVWMSLTALPASWHGIYQHRVCNVLLLLCRCDKATGAPTSMCWVDKPDGTACKPELYGDQPLPAGPVTHTCKSGECVELAAIKPGARDITNICAYMC